MTFTPEEEDATRELLQTAHLRQAEAQLDAIVRINSQVYEKAVAYTNAVILGGYAALFAGWGFANKFMTAKLSATTGALIVASVLTFVLWEVYKGILTGRAFGRVAQAIALDASCAVQLLLEHEREQQKVMLLQARLWCVVLVVTLTTGVGAAVTLAYAFVAHLVSSAAG